MKETLDAIHTDACTAVAKIFAMLVATAIQGVLIGALFEHFS